MSIKPAERTRPSAKPTASPGAAARESIAARTRLRWQECLFWLLPIAACLLLPDRLGLLTEIAILGLFALSLDLILGFAGIVSLGHAAFFGLGAYLAGLLAVHGWHEPVSGLLFTGVAAGFAGFLASFLVLRGTDLTRLMVTLGISLMLGEAANRAAWLTGGADGLSGIAIDPIFGTFAFDIYGQTAFGYAMVTLFVAFCAARRVMASAFGLTLRGIKANRLRMTALGCPVNRYLVVIYTFSAGLAGLAGALLAQTTQFVSLDVLDFQRSAEVLLVLIIGGAGYLYGGLIGAVVFKAMHDVLADLTPQYWQFWLGLLLVILVLCSRDGIQALVTLIQRRLRRQA